MKQKIYNKFNFNSIFLISISNNIYINLLTLFDKFIFVAFQFW